MGHGYGQEKLDVFAVLQKGFENAVYIGYAPDWDGNNLTNHYFAFPIMYNGERKLVFCRVRSDINATRLYVHEIYLESDINKKAEAFQTAAEQDETLKPHGRFSPYENILAHFYIASGDFKKTFKFFVQVNPISEKNPENSGLKASLPNARQTETEERLKSEAAEVIEPKLTKEEQKLRSDLDDVQKTTIGKLVDILLPGKSEYLGNMFKK